MSDSIWYLFSVVGKLFANGLWGVFFCRRSPTRGLPSGSNSLPARNRLQPARNYSEYNESFMQTSGAMFAS